jgi:PTH1 family peptidyl-tRNA hydrolase
MNQSGKSVTALMRNFKIFPTNIAVIHDDITLPVNRIKMSNHGSSGGHNGIDDILTRIGPKFTRIKIGIGNKIDKDQSLADYVLQKFTSSDDSILKNLKPEVFQGIKLLIDNGVEAAMNTINRRPKTL